jgi:phage-related protein (TIGR01555 family)
VSRRNKSRPRGAQPNTEAVSVQDAFSNPLFRLGYGSQSPLEATEYPLTRMTDNYALLNSLYRDNWVVQNVVGIIPDDMTKKWFAPAGAVGPEHLKELERVQRVTALRERVNEGLRWGRLYGGAAGLIMIRGQEGMLGQPLELESIYPGTFQGLYILDRWQGVVPGMELVFEGGEPVPAYYSITDARGNTVAKVHHSRLVRFTGRDLPFLERVAELYWGESEVEALYNDVVKHDNVAANMAALTFRANVDTMEVQNLDQLFSVTSGEQQRRFWNVMQAQSVMKSNFGMQLVNRGDQIKNTQYTFTGLQEVYDSMCLDLSGASRIPVTKLFGRSPAGMNATGESDLRNYYDYVDTLREAKLRPILEKLLPVLAMSAWGAVPDGLDITFPPLWTPTAAEVAEIALKKAQAIRDTFQAGLFRADTAQRELKKLADETGMFDSISEEEIAANTGKTYQDVTALRDPLAGLGYGGEISAPFEGAAQDALTWDYSPSQPRDKKGRWTSGGGNSKIGKTKYAPSKRANKRGKTVSAKTFGILRGEFNTKYPGAKTGQQGQVSYKGKRYWLEADGSGSVIVKKSWKE